MLVGRRQEVLEAMLRVIAASLEAGAHIMQVKVEAEADAGRFGRRS